MENKKNENVEKQVVNVNSDIYTKKYYELSKEEFISLDNVLVKLEKRTLKNGKVNCSMTVNIGPNDDIVHVYSNLPLTDYNLICKLRKLDPEESPHSFWAKARFKKGGFSNSEDTWISVQVFATSKIPYNFLLNQIEKLSADLLIAEDKFGRVVKYHYDQKNRKVIDELQKYHIEVVEEVKDIDETYEEVWV